MFDAERFCSEHAIDFAPRGHQHRRPGWTNIACPFCVGHTGYHAGINQKNAYVNCYRCGHHWLPKTIAIVLNTSIHQAKALITKYSTGEIHEEYKQALQRPSKLALPHEFGKLQSMHWQYLKSRGFSANVARQCDLMGVGMAGSYAMRIIAPIYLDYELISFQGRDITDKSKLRYKACEASNEVWPHQNTIYRIDKCTADTILIVEGITDQWRIGNGCGATFGIEWTTSQARMIASRFKRFYILYDVEEQAQEKALSLYHHLTARGLDGEILTLNVADDPGSMTDKQAKELKGDLGIL